MKLRLRLLGPLATRACELVTFVAFYLTPDVDKRLLLVPAAAGTLAWGARLLLSDRWVLSLATLAVVGGLATMPEGASTVAILLRVMVPGHALLWLAREERLYRPWRLSLAFLGIVLAAILAPEAHMFVLIFLFVLLAAQALSFTFIENNFRKRDPDSLARPVRPVFVLTVAVLSCLIFLTSLVIFPILPRSNWNGDSSRDGSSSAGFSETVSFRSATLFWAERGDASPVMWLFRPDGSAPWPGLIPFGLLRGRALSRFNGVEWSEQALARQAVPVPRRSRAAKATIELVRLPLPTAMLPVPYGTLRVALDSREEVSSNAAGEWAAPAAVRRCVSYAAEVAGVPEAGGGDEVRPEHLELDHNRFSRLAALGLRLGSAAKDDAEKLRSVARFFQAEGFTGELGPVGAASDGTHPLNRFLFETKHGHCELFATAGALLLRAMGVPARVVTGFRVGSLSGGTVLTVHNSDAHAWVEAWQKGHGWVPVDYSPFVERPSGWLGNAFGRLSDFTGAYWNRYIVSYEFAGLDLGMAAKGAGAAGAAVLALLLGVFLFRWARAAATRSLRAQLSAVLRELEEGLVHQAGMFPDRAYKSVPGAADWLRAYQGLRFGAKEPSREEVAALRMVARELVRDAVKANRSAIRREAS